VAMHGYMNSRETQDGFAIEFCQTRLRRPGADMIGHAYSEPAASTGNFLSLVAEANRHWTYLRSLDFVDKDNIGLEGHSMGGWGLVMTAFANQNNYRSIVLEGSSTGTFCPPGTPTSRATCWSSSTNTMSSLNSTGEPRSQVMPPKGTR